MTRRTPPRGYPVAQSSPETWDDHTHPGMSEYELTEMRRRRREKLSEAHSMAKEVKFAYEELKRRMGNAELQIEATRRDISQIKEGQVGLMAVANQIMVEVKTRNDTDQSEKRLEATEGGAWKRQMLASALAAGAVIVAVISLAGKC